MGCVPLVNLYFITQQIEKIDKLVKVHINDCTTTDNQKEIASKKYLIPISFFNKNHSIINNNSYSITMVHLTAIYYYEYLINDHMYILSPLSQIDIIQSSLNTNKSPQCWADNHLTIIQVKCLTPLQLDYLYVLELLLLCLDISRAVQLALKFNNWELVNF